MYYYVADNGFRQGQASRLENRIKARLEELGIGGEWTYGSSREEIASLAQDAIRSGHTTVVAVGDDSTADEVINALAKESAAIGFIPASKNSILGAHLGIESPIAACDILASRRLTPYSLVAAGQRFYVSPVTLRFGEPQAAPPSGRLVDRIPLLRRSPGRAGKTPAQRCRIRVDDTYTIEANIASMRIANRKLEQPLSDNRLAITFTDGSGGPALTSLFTSSGRTAAGAAGAGESRIFADRIILEADPSAPVTLDGAPGGRTPVVIRLTDRRVRLITQKVHTPFAPTQ